jgi:hypothetical protein
MRYIGTISSDARGKLGGLVFTRARNGTNVLAKRVPLNPSTPQQQQQRLTVAAATASWRNLTGTEQASWVNLALQYTFTNSLAQSYSPTGFQLFCQAWIGSNNAGTSFSTTAPLTPPVITVATSIELAIVAGALVASFYSVSTPFSGYLSFSLSSVLSATINYTKGVRRRQFYTNFGTSTVDCTSLYTGYYGALPVSGDLLSAHVVTTDASSGITATPFVQLVTVT